MAATLGALDRLVLSDAAWGRMAPLIIGRPDQKGSTGRDNRMFVEGVLWMMRTGSPWRDLPEVFGDWNSVFRRFSRWSSKGAWQRIFQAMPDDTDVEYRIVDSTIIRATNTPLGRRRGAEDQAIGRSRGGLSTEIHLAVRGLGCPVRFHPTAGQRGDCPPAYALVEGLPAKAVMADVAYDADPFRQAIADKGAVAVIPNNPSRARKYLFDKHLNAQRHMIACCFSRLKQFRRVATRFEKTTRNHVAIVTLAATVLWLRQVSTVPGAGSRCRVPGLRFRSAAPALSSRIHSGSRCRRA